MKTSHYKYLIACSQEKEEHKTVDSKIFPLEHCFQLDFPETIENILHSQYLFLVFSSTIRCYLMEKKDQIQILYVRVASRTLDFERKLLQNIRLEDMF